MCFYSPPPMAMNAPAPIKERDPNLAQESQLAKPRKVVDQDKVTGVEYGSQKKPVADQKAASADALRIKLNTGTQNTTGNTGGINV
jgi:hypothetical protein